MLHSASQPSPFVQHRSVVDNDAFDEQFPAEIVQMPVSGASVAVYRQVLSESQLAYSKIRLLYKNLLQRNMELADELEHATSLTISSRAAKEVNRNNEKINLLAKAFVLMRDLFPVPTNQFIMMTLPNPSLTADDLRDMVRTLDTQRETLPIVRSEASLYDLVIIDKELKLEALAELRSDCPAYGNKFRRACSNARSGLIANARQCASTILCLPEEVFSATFNDFDSTPALHALWYIDVGKKKFSRDHVPVLYPQGENGQRLYLGIYLFRVFELVLILKGCYFGPKSVKSGKRSTPPTLGDILHLTADRILETAHIVAAGATVLVWLVSPDRTFESGSTPGPSNVIWHELYDHYRTLITRELENPERPGMRNTIAWIAKELFNPTIRAPGTSALSVAQAVDECPFTLDFNEPGPDELANLPSQFEYSVQVDIASRPAPPLRPNAPSLPSRLTTINPAHPGLTYTSGSSGRSPTPNATSSFQTRSNMSPVAQPLNAGSFTRPQPTVSTVAQPPSSFRSGTSYSPAISAPPTSFDHNIQPPQAVSYAAPISAGTRHISSTSALSYASTASLKQKSSSTAAIKAFRMNSASARALVSPVTQAPSGEYEDYTKEIHQISSGSDLTDEEDFQDARQAPSQRQIQSSQAAPLDQIQPSQVFVTQRHHTASHPQTSAFSYIGRTSPIASTLHTPAPPINFARVDVEEGVEPANPALPQRPKPRKRGTPLTNVIPQDSYNAGASHNAHQSQTGEPLAYDANQAQVVQPRHQTRSRTANKPSAPA
ncbi:hypothetical protein BDN72DRAFT_896655 [Pluteus cervinus]|uniref:Uncharacterized protein n=1 Tax=Pluteus cervinus TaxID=181527 RepID=A0ACD3AWJ8_9AGAR|nr:hypothetical protein BDN72DRAFT_896655 [Pluteus cervinus]